jgi:ATP-binding cassette, subfamily B, bacterial MsbA
METPSKPPRFEGLKGLYSPIWFYIKPYKRTIIFSIFLGGLISLVHVGIVQLVGKIQDEIFVGKTLEKLMVLSLSIMGIFLVNLLLRFFHRTLLRYVAERASLRLRDEMFRKLLKIDMKHIHARSQGDLLSRFLNDAKVFHYGLEIASDFIKEGLTVIALLSYAIYLNWQFSLTALAFSPFIAYVFYRVSTSSKKNTRLSQELMSNMTKQYEEAFSGIREIRMYHREKHMTRFFDAENKRYLKRWMRVVRVEEMAAPLIEFFGAVIGGILMWYGGNAVINGEMSSGAFISYLAALGLTQHPLRNLNRINVKISEATSAATRILEFLNLKSDVEVIPKNPKPVPIPPQEIQFKDVTFSYLSNHPVIRNISMNFKVNHKYAFVGPSGGGKSTLYSLLVRFYDPVQGNILIDGTDIREFHPHDYRKLFSYVTQEVFLFHDTVLENIRFSNPIASKAEIIEAAKMANAHDFIMSLPKKYDSVVGDRGIRLSGGQRQRISIARAFLKDSPILLFDEATSHLDTHSEQNISEALTRLKHQKTCFIIAHRLSTIVSADEIIVLDHGEVVAAGTHSSLLKNNSTYKLLYQEQQLAEQI